MVRVIFEMRHFILALLLQVLFPLLLRAQSGPAGVSLEKFTGTWCGWCPYGNTVLDSIEQRLEDDAVILTWHFDDVFEIAAHDTLASAISNGGHPVVSVNRAPVRSNNPIHFNEQHPWYSDALAALQPPFEGEWNLGSSTFDPSTRFVTLPVAFFPTLINEWPDGSWLYSVVIITEDSLRADQSLYSEDGKPLPKLRNYSHDRVVRQVVGRVLGDSMHYAWGSGRMMQEYLFRLDGKIQAHRARLNVLLVLKTPESAQRVVAAIRSDYLGEQPAGIGQDTQEHLIQIVPNPSNGMLTILSSNVKHVEVIDLLGRSVYSAVINGSGNQAIDLRHLPQGSYRVLLTHSTGEVTSRAIVLQR